MLTSFDDFPVHQTSQPIGHTATADLNHYDRYFFSGLTADHGLHFATAMGLYPNRHVVDAAFSVVLGGGTQDAQQINVYASQRAPKDRLHATRVGPIEVDVIEPLDTLRITVEAPEHGLRADLTFRRRSEVVEEPHFLFRTGARVLLDYTRLTQFGRWSGWIEVDGEHHDIDAETTLGARDRSWGVRPVGEPSSTGAPVADPQFFWRWAPVNFDGFSTHFDVNEMTDGHRWHDSGFIVPESGRAEPMRDIDYRIIWRPGTRAMQSFELDLHPWNGEPSTLVFEPLFDFHMSGIGYGHREWRHGSWRGEAAVGGDRWDLPVDDPVRPDLVHIQTISKVTSSGALGDHVGHGLLEQLAIGRHTPTGLDGIFDGA